MTAYKATFKKLISGELPVYLKEVSIGQISDGEFERHEKISNAAHQLSENVYTSKDDQGNKRRSEERRVGKEC